LIVTQDSQKVHKIGCIRLPDLPEQRYKALQEEIPDELPVFGNVKRVKTGIARVVPARLQSLYRNRMVVALETFFLIRLLTAYDVGTDVVLLYILSQTTDKWWLFIASCNVMIPVLLKAILCSRIFINKLTRPRQTGGQELPKPLAVFIYTLCIGPFVFAVDFYFLFACPFAPPAEAELMGTLEKISPFVETFESIAQTVLTTYMHFREKELGREVVLTFEEILLFAWLPAGLGFCKKMLQLKSEAELVGLNLFAYVRELILCPLGWSVPNLHLMSTRKEVSFCKLGKLTKEQQKKLFKSCVSGKNAGLGKLHRLIFDEGNQLNLYKAAEQLNLLAQTKQVFKVHFDWRLTVKERADFFGALTVNPFLQISMGDRLFLAANNLVQEKLVNVDKLLRAKENMEEKGDMRLTVTDLLEAGMSAQLIKNAGFSVSDMRYAGFETASALRHAGFSASELRSGGFSSQQLRDAGFTASELRNAGFEADSILRRAAALRYSDFSASELKEEGFSAKELRITGFSAQELEMAGFSAQELKIAGFSSEALRLAGFSAAKLSIAGFSAEELRHAGFPAEELRSVGLSAEVLARKATRVFTDEELRMAGFSVKEMMGAGLSAIQLKMAGFSDKDLMTAGFSAQEMMSLGLSAQDLRSAGFSAEALRSAGFPAEELRSVGFSGSELRMAGFTVKELRLVGFSASELVRAGYSAQEWRSGLEADEEGFAAEALRSSGCSVEELRAAGFSAEELTEAGSSAEQLRSAGFSAKELMITGFAARALREAGYSLRELLSAGFSIEDMTKAITSAEELKSAGFSAEELVSKGFSRDYLRSAGYEAGELMAGLTPEEVRSYFTAHLG